ncbi:hypothetical protein ABTX81_17375 [Kitasatospora sp. NPDC097605]|uniref:hypothetical protein n=1 Tax=Kitasatospora sp. NPDC097605 TaxID=3157226 RepID=UPI0033181D22
MDDLGLPPRFELYVHHDGRQGVFVLRKLRIDPTTMVVMQTAVTFEHIGLTGERIRWSLKCAVDPTT